MGGRIANRPRSVDVCRQVPRTDRCVRPGRLARHTGDSLTGRAAEPLSYAAKAAPHPPGTAAGRRQGTPDRKPGCTSPQLFPTAHGVRPMPLAARSGLIHRPPIADARTVVTCSRRAIGRRPRVPRRRGLFRQGPLRAVAGAGQIRRRLRASRAPPVRPASSRGRPCGPG